MTCKHKNTSYVGVQHLANRILLLHNCESCKTTLVKAMCTEPEVKRPFDFIVASIGAFTVFGLMVWIMVGGGL